MICMAMLYKTFALEKCIIIADIPLEKCKIYVMERFLYNQLKNWKDSKTRKPLILEGERQVGKTWLLKEFGKNDIEQSQMVNVPLVLTEEYLRCM